MVNVLIALNTRMQLPMCNIANVLLLMLMLLKRVIWMHYIEYTYGVQQCNTVHAYALHFHECMVQYNHGGNRVLYNGKCIIDIMSYVFVCACIAYTCVLYPAIHTSIFIQTQLLKKGYRIFWDDYKAGIAVRFQSTFVILLGLYDIELWIFQFHSLCDIL